MAALAPKVEEPRQEKREKKSAAAAGGSSQMEVDLDSSAGAGSVSHDGKKIKVKPYLFESLAFIGLHPHEEVNHASLTSLDSCFPWLWGCCVLSNSEEVLSPCLVFSWLRFGSSSSST